MCGIWGIVNTHPRKFDYSTFCTLGIANDSRGGDSCGIFIDGKYEYGADKDDKYFCNFFLTSKILDDVKESTIAFGHCRKASVGVIDESTAQPVIIKNDKGEVEFVVMHNGTIYNYDDLAKKYIPNIDIKDMTDSQVMARIFYECGYDVLDEYIGGAVFAVIDYRKPQVLFFKGASKESEFSKKQTEERPLYFCIDKEKEEMVFSSIASYLYALKPNLVCYTLNPNLLVTFNGTETPIVKEYKRKDVTQKAPFTYYSSNLWNTNYYDYNDYISLDLLRNTYSFHGSLMHEEFIIGRLGKIYKKVKGGSKEIYFWDGVALKNKACFLFLSKLLSESRISRREFAKTFINVIRFLSVDGVYFDSGLWYKAISPTERVLYTGDINMLTANGRMRFANGIKTTTIYGKICDSSFDKLYDNEDIINFKEIKQKCLPLMKQLTNGPKLITSTKL